MVDPVRGLRWGLASLLLTLLVGSGSRAAPLLQAVPNGLLGERFPVQGWTGSVTRRIDATVNFTSFAAADFSDNSADDLSVRWVGCVRAPGTGTTPINVTFYCRSDDGARVWVDGVPVVDQWRYQGIPGQPGPSGTIALVPGQLYSIVVEMFEGGGGEGCILEWAYPGQAQQVIPTGSLFAQVAPPQFSIAPGTLSNCAVLSIRCPTPGATITYSLNGGVSTPYTGPIVLGSGTTNVSATASRVTPGASLVDATTTGTFTVNDTTPPSIAMVQSYGENKVRVVFSEPVQAASAQTTTNYTFTPAATVTGAALQYDQQTVILTVTGLTPGTDYVLRVNNVQDRATPANAIPGPPGGSVTYSGAYKVFTHRPWRETNLVDWYRFDERSEVTAADSSGSGTGGNTGTLPLQDLAGGNTGPYWIEEGKFLGALFFDGENDFVTISDVAPVVGSGPASVAFWIRTGMRTGGTNGNLRQAPAVLGVEVGGNNDIRYGTFNQNGQILTQAGDSAPIVAARNVVNWQWHHVVFTRDPSTGQLRAYIDGDLEVTAPVTGDTGNKTGALTRIGWPVGTPFWAACGMHLDELRIYNEILTQAEAVSLANTIPRVLASGPTGPVDVGSTVSLTGTLNPAQDDGIPNGSSITWQWTQVDGPAGGATIATPTAATTNVTFNQGGSYVFRVVATDSHLKTSDDVRVTVPFIRVTPVTLTTAEGGTDASFQIVLTAQPTGTVTISLASSDTTEGEVRDSGGNPITQVQFTTSNWNVPQTVLVRPVDDFIRDGPITYSVNVGPVTSTDTRFSSENPPDVSVTNNDNDTPGIAVTPLSIVTSESGGTDSFSVVLTSQPQGSDVTIPVSSSNPGEGNVSVTSLTFTGTNWNVPQIVTVTGVDDTVLDFTQSYTIVLGPATSADPDYSGMDAADVSAVNLDNETIPDPDQAWGNCGATGAEGLLALIAVALWRRRARRA
jgi:hypothetical protein